MNEKYNIIIETEAELKEQSTQNSMKLRYLGCQEEKEEKLRERLTKNLQRCDANYGDNKHQGYTALSRTNNNETYT